EVLAGEVIVRSESGSQRAKALQLAAQLNARQSNFTDATEHATAALVAADDDQRLRAGIELDLAYYGVSLGDIGGAEPHARAAVAQARAAGEEGMLGEALAVLTMSEFLAGRGLNETILTTALALEDPHSTSAVYMRPRVIAG